DQIGFFGGGTGVSATSNPSGTTPGTGTVTANGHVTTFQNLEGQDITGMATVNLLFPNGDDVVTIHNATDFTAGGTTPALGVSGTSGGVAFVPVALFNNTTVNLNTTTVDGNDTVTIDSANNEHNNKI